MFGPPTAKPVWLCSTLLLGACTLAAPPPQTVPATSDTRPCSRNFRIGGNGLEGYSFRTSGEREGATPAAVFTHTERALVSRGYLVTSSNESSGTISSTAQGQRVTVNAAVGTTPTRAVQVHLVAQLQGGTSTAPAAVLKEFCDILDDALGTR